MVKTPTKKNLWENVSVWHKFTVTHCLLKNDIRKTQGFTLSKAAGSFRNCWQEFESTGNHLQKALSFSFSLSGQCETGTVQTCPILYLKNWAVLFHESEKVLRYLTCLGRPWFWRTNLGNGSYRFVLNNDQTCNKWKCKTFILCAVRVTDGFAKIEQ